MITVKERINKIFKGIKISKKFLLSLILLASITIGTGINTYSWFTSSAESNVNTIHAGTFKVSIDNETEKNSNIALFNLPNIQPGVLTPEKTITFTNTGTLDMILKGTLSMTNEDEDKADDVEELKAYKVVAYIYKNNLESTPLYVPTKAANNADIPVSVDEFNTELNKILDLNDEKHEIFQPNDKLICKFSIVLSETLAKNTHQGDTVTTTFQVNARQNVEGSSYTE